MSQGTQAIWGNDAVDRLKTQFGRELQSGQSRESEAVGARGTKTWVENRCSVGGLRGHGSEAFVSK